MSASTLFDDAADFDGPDYDRDRDHTRLKGQLGRTYDVMCDRRWRTLGEIEAITGDPQASISARLRDFPKVKFGQRLVEKRLRGDPKSGRWEYRLDPDEGSGPPPDSLPLVGQVHQLRADVATERVIADRLAAALRVLDPDNDAIKFYDADRAA